MSHFRHQLFLLTAGLLLPTALILSSCNDSPIESGPEPTPIEITWSHLVAENLSPYRPNIGDRGCDGLKEVRISSVVSDTVMNDSGPRYSVGLYKKFEFGGNEVPRDNEYTITVVDAGGEKSKDFGVSGWKSLEEVKNRPHFVIAEQTGWLVKSDTKAKSKIY